jgi:radical SAM superfamily enzyme YgiQ (UPF0313 family)
MNRRQLRYKMTSKTLLVVPKLDKGVSKKFPPEIYDNLGIGYLASFLESRGETADIVDYNSPGFEESRFLSRAAKDNYEIAGISVGSRQELSGAATIARGLRDAGFTGHITLGGHYVSSRAQKILQGEGCIDSVVSGEGEETLYGLCRAAANGGHLEEIPGVIVKREGIIIRAPRRGPIEDLDSLPFPKRYNLDSIVNCRNNGRGVYVLTSRGCNGGCSFCIAPLNKGWRARSADNVVQELQALYKRGAKVFNFCDENFLGHSAEGRRRAIQIAEGIKKAGIEINYHASFRVGDFDSSVIDALIKSGLNSINMGVESFSQRQLNTYKKGTPVKKILDSLEEIKKRKIGTRLTFIIFDPYVTLDELQENCKYMQEYSQYMHFRNVRSRLEPLEGSELWVRLQKEGLLEELGEGKFGFKFVDRSAGAVWKSMEMFKMGTADLEAAYRQLNRRLMLYGCDESRDKFELLDKIRTDAESQMTLIWLDFMEYSIARARSGDLSSSQIPPRIKAQCRGIMSKLNEAGA